MDCLEMKKSAIQDWFSECLKRTEAAELYAELLYELREQLKYSMSILDEE